MLHITEVHLGARPDGGKSARQYALQAYAFPKFHFDLHLCRSNRPPHTAVRGPGEIQATVLAEHLIEHVAARLRLDPMLVRERNFITHDGGLLVPLCDSQGGPCKMCDGSP